MAILIPPIIPHRKDDIAEFHIKNVSINILHLINRKNVRYLPNEAFGEPKSSKMEKRGYSNMVLF